MTTSLLPSPLSTLTDEAVLLGAQTPRVRRVPHYERTLGPEVVDFMAHVGRPLDEWQANMVVDSFGLRPDGYWASFEIVGLVPRQNGKGAFTEAMELGGLFLFGDELIMHSAHLFKTSKQSFQRVIDIITNSDWLRRRVKRVVRARGDEEIELLAKFGGGRLLYFSRSGGSGRGFTGDKTIFDEAAYLTIEQYQAATPTLATVPNPQIIYTGTPPDEDVGPMPEDSMMPSVRKRATAGEDRISIHEWSPPEGFDRGDPRIHAACNPAYNHRIQAWFLEKQLANFTAAGKPGKFDTEHLGVWPPDRAAHWQVLSEADYLDLRDEASQATDPLVFAIDSTPGGGHSSISAAGARPDGNLHGEVIDHAQGTGWVVPRAVELDARWKPAAWVVDIGGAAGFMVPQLQEAGLNVVTMTPRQVGQAFAMFKAAASSEEQAEVAESSEELTGKPAGSLDVPFVVPKIRIRPGRHGAAIASAVEGATTRRIGDGTTWDRRSTDVVISPVVSMTNAVYGFVTREPAEPEQPFFGTYR